MRSSVDRVWGNGSCNIRVNFQAGKTHLNPRLPLLHHPRKTIIILQQFHHPPLRLPLVFLTRQPLSLQLAAQLITPLLLRLQQTIQLGNLTRMRSIDRLRVGDDLGKDFLKALVRQGFVVERFRSGGADSGCGSTVRIGNRRFGVDRCCDEIDRVGA